MKIPGEILVLQKLKAAYLKSNRAVAANSTGHWVSDPQMLNRIYWSEICLEVDVPLDENKCV